MWGWQHQKRRIPCSWICYHASGIALCIMAVLVNRRSQESQMCRPLEAQSRHFVCVRTESLRRLCSLEELRVGNDWDDDTNILFTKPAARCWLCHPIAIAVSSVVLFAFCAGHGRASQCETSPLQQWRAANYGKRSSFSQGFQMFSDVLRFAESAN